MRKTLSVADEAEGTTTFPPPPPRARCASELPPAGGARGGGGGGGVRAAPRGRRRGDSAPGGRPGALRRRREPEPRAGAASSPGPGALPAGVGWGGHTGSHRGARRGTTVIRGPCISVGAEERCIDISRGLRSRGGGGGGGKARWALGAPRPRNPSPTCVGWWWWWVLHRASPGCGAGAQPSLPPPPPCQGQRAGTARHPPRTRVAWGGQSRDPHPTKFLAGDGGCDKGWERGVTLPSGRRSRSTKGAPRQPRERRARHKDPLRPPHAVGGCNAPERGGTAPGARSRAHAPRTAPLAGSASRSREGAAEPGESQRRGHPGKGAPAVPGASSALAACPAGTPRGSRTRVAKAPGTLPTAVLTHRGSTPHHGARSW